LLVGLMILISMSGIGLMLTLLFGDLSRQETTAASLIFLVVAGPLLWAAFSVSQRG
jgi:hypothetical protein